MYTQTSPNYQSSTLSNVIFPPVQTFQGYPSIEQVKSQVSVPISDTTAGLIYNTFNEMTTRRVNMVIIKLFTPQGNYYVPITNRNSPNDVVRKLMNFCNFKVVGYNLIPLLHDPESPDVMFGQAISIC